MRRSTASSRTARAEDALEHEAGRLARPEAGHPSLAGEPTDGLVDGAVEALGGQLDLEHHG